MLQITIDLSGLTQMFQGLEGKIRQAEVKAAAELAPAIHAHILEKASEKLHSRRQLYVESLGFQQLSDDAWAITLDGKARWIEDGMPAHSMVDDLLSSPKAKTARNGSRYLSVPFGHGPGKGATTMTPAEATLQDTVRSALRQRGIPYGKLELGPDGRPRTGLLHAFDVLDQPKKTAQGPGQGWGPIGQVRQGATGIPFLQGVRVYQRPAEGGKVKRAVMTFRTVSSKHAEEGRWYHPGLAPVKLFDEAYEWALRHLEQVILPRMASQIVGF